MKSLFVTAMLSFVAMGPNPSQAQINDLYRARPTLADESAITVGMSEAEVLAILGQPSGRTRYGSGVLTWEYPIASAIFYIDFAPDHRVVATQQLLQPAGE